MYRNTINTIRHNKTYCTLIATMILASYSLNLVKEIDDTDPYPDYWENIIPMKMKCDYSISHMKLVFENGSLTYQKVNERGFLKYWANCFSYQYLGNDRILPIVFSVVIVYLTYVLANQITGNRIIGLISMAAISLNPMLTKFDSSPTYDQMWSMFFLLSLVLIYKKPLLGIVSFPLSVISKILAVAYMPGIFLHIIIDKKIRHRKAMIVSAIILGGIGVISLAFFGVGNKIGMYPERLLDGFLSIFENIWPVFPVIIGCIVIDRFFMPKERPEGKRIVLVWLAWILTTTPLIYLFTAGQLQFGYRFVPFAVFLSIYLGIVCVQLGNFIVETRLRKQSLKSVSS